MSSSSSPADAPKKPQFGTRLLTDVNAVFEHNAWDHVEWDDDQRAVAQSTSAVQQARPMSVEQAERLLSTTAEQWDSFYDKHTDGFFKDRNWLFTEFPELLTSVGDSSSSSPVSVLEVGCGVGNTVFPIVKHACNTPNAAAMHVYCCDHSAVAVDIVKRHALYDEMRCTAFVWDITNYRSLIQDQSASIPIPEASLDVISMIFVLSAIAPERHRQVIANLYRLLKPGGVLLFRDYARYDLTQLRFKAASSRNVRGDWLYARGDGTLVFYFTEDYVRDLMSVDAEELQNWTDRRLIVNRAKQLKMYRQWIQAKYRKTGDLTEAK